MTNEQKQIIWNFLEENLHPKIKENKYDGERISFIIKSDDFSCSLIFSNLFLTIQNTVKLKEFLSIENEGQNILDQVRLGCKEILIRNDGVT